MVKVVLYEDKLKNKKEFLRPIRVLEVQKMLKKTKE